MGKVRKTIFSTVMLCASKVPDVEKTVSILPPNKKIRAKATNPYNIVHITNGFSFLGFLLVPTIIGNDGLYSLSDSYNWHQEKGVYLLYHIPNGNIMERSIKHETMVHKKSCTASKKLYNCLRKPKTEQFPCSGELFGFFNVLQGRKKLFLNQPHKGKKHAENFADQCAQCKTGKSHMKSEGENNISDYVGDDGEGGDEHFCFRISKGTYTAGKCIAQCAENIAQQLDLEIVLCENKDYLFSAQ